MHFTIFGIFFQKPLILFPVYGKIMYVKEIFYIFIVPQQLKAVYDMYCIFII